MAALVAGNTVAATARRWEATSYRPAFRQAVARLRLPTRHRLRWARAEAGAALLDSSPLRWRPSPPRWPPPNAFNANWPWLTVPSCPDCGNRRLNATVVDSTALPEQVIDTTFGAPSAAQASRCSACDCCAHEAIADTVEQLLAGAVATSMWARLRDWYTDVGPVIDQAAQARLQAHLDELNQPRLETRTAACIRSPMRPYPQVT